MARRPRRGWWRCSGACAGPDRPIASGHRRHAGHAIGFQVAGTARAQLECIAEAGERSGADRWPMELTFHVEHPLKKGVTPAQSAGWGQQLCCDVEFADEPTVRGFGAPTSFGGTQGRIAVPGKEKSGPQDRAAVVAADASRGDSGSSADETPGGGGG